MLTLEIWITSALRLIFSCVIHIYIYIYIILSCHQHGYPWPSFALSFLTSGWSSGLHPVSSQSCCIYVRADRPAFARPCEGVHRSTSLMSSSLLIQQCPECLVRLDWIIFEVGGRIVSVHVVHPYSSIEMMAAWGII